MESSLYICGKATLDFKVRSFSIVHKKLLACLPAISIYNAYIPRHSNNCYRTVAASREAVSGIELSNGTSYHRISFTMVLLKNCLILHSHFLSLNGTTGQHTQLKFLIICTCIKGNGEVRCKWSLEVMSVQKHHSLHSSPYTKVVHCMKHCVWILLDPQFLNTHIYNGHNPFTNGLVIHGLIDFQHIRLEQVCMFLLKYL